MNMKRVGASLRDGKLYLEPEGREKESWLWVHVGEVTVLPWPMADEALGEAVLRALGQSLWDVPKPPKRHGIGRVAELAGYKSWVAFAKLARLVTIVWEDGKGVEFIPSYWEGPRKRHANGDDQTVVADALSPAEVGRALKMAIDLCR